MWPATEDGLLHVLAGTASEEDVRAFELKAAAHAKTEDCTFSLDERALQFLATANPVASTLFTNISPRLSSQRLSAYCRPTVHGNNLHWIYV